MNPSPSPLERVNALIREAQLLIALSWGHEARTPEWMMWRIARLVRIRQALRSGRDSNVGGIDPEQPKGV